MSGGVLTVEQQAAVQRRTVLILSLGQVLGECREERVAAAPVDGAPAAEVAARGTFTG